MILCGRKSWKTPPINIPACAAQAKIHEFCNDGCNFTERHRYSKMLHTKTSKHANTIHTHTHPHREPSSSPPTLSADRTIHFIFDSLCGHDELETWKEFSELRRDSFYRSVFLSALLSLFPHSVHVCFFMLSILRFLSHAYVHSCSLCNSDYLIFTFLSLSSPLFSLHLYTHNLPFTCVHLFLLIAVFYRSLFSSLAFSFSPPLPLGIWQILDAATWEWRGRRSGGLNTERSTEMPWAKAHAHAHILSRNTHPCVTVASVSKIYS